MHRAFPTVFLLNVGLTLGQFEEVFKRCGEDTTGCFGIPPDCGDSSSCTAKVFFWRADSERTQVVLFGEITAASYVAMGTSTDASMGDDLVFSCVSAGDAALVRASRNVGHSGSQFLAGRSGDMVSAQNLTMADGKALCAFQIATSPTAEGGLSFRLDEEDYHLLLAAGRYDAGAGRLLRHTDRLATSEPVRLHAESYGVGGVGGGAAQGSPSALIQAHGVLMVLAWVVVAWTGMEFPL